MKIGITGKTNTGKSTLFSAATMVDVEISNRVFTTIKPNTGIAYVTTPCICKELGVKCNPQNSKCENQTRLIPVTMVDIAGLVPGAHLGKGLGNQFLSDIMEAEGLIHIVDLSGKTNEKGEPTEGYDPEKDIKFLEEEIDYWIEGILSKNWKNIERKAKTQHLYKVVYDQLAGLGISEEKVKEIIKSGYNDLLDLATKIRKENKPIILAGNKIDLKSAQDNFEKLKAEYDITPVCAEAELALRKAEKQKLVEYVPGSNSFEPKKELPKDQAKALDFIRRDVLERYKSTGVQQIINKLVFERLEYIVVYPVEDENKFADKKGNVLPDAYLMKKGSSALDLAFKVHTDIGEKFIGAIDCKTKRKIGKEHILRDRDIIKILSRN